MIEVLAIYGFGVILFLCMFSIEKACGMTFEGRIVTIVSALIWPAMLIHIVPFGIKCFFSKETWR